MHARISARLYWHMRLGHILSCIALLEVFLPTRWNAPKQAGTAEAAICSACVLLRADASVHSCELAKVLTARVRNAIADVILVRCQDVVIHSGLLSDITDGVGACESQRVFMALIHILVHKLAVLFQAACHGVAN